MALKRKNNSRSRAKKHGFRARNSSFSGKKTLRARRAKGRHTL